MRLLRSFFAAGLAAALVATPAMADDTAPFRKRGRAAQAQQGHQGRFAQRRPAQHRFERGRAAQGRFAQGRTAHSRFAQRGSQQRGSPQRFGQRGRAQRGFQGRHPLAFHGSTMQRRQRMQQMQRMQRFQRMQRGHAGQGARAQHSPMRRGGQFHRSMPHGQMRDGRLHNSQGGMRNGRMQKGQGGMRAGRMQKGRGGMRGRQGRMHTGKGRMRGDRGARQQRGSPRGQQPAFARLDRNGDGMIDKREFAALAQMKAQARPGTSRKGRAQARQRGQQGARARPNANRQPQAAQQKRMQARSAAILYRLQQADTDGDGKLSRREAPDMLKQRFAQLDQDEDGFLGKGELKRLVKGLGKKGDARRGPQQPAKKKAQKRKGGNKP